MSSDHVAAAAGLKDALALLEEATVDVLSLLPSSFAGRSCISGMVTDTISFLRQSFIPTLAQKADRKMIYRDPISNKVCVKLVTPFAGAISADLLSHSSRQQPKATSADQLRVGTINPARTGFSHLRTNDILWWRWWEIGLACDELGLQFVVLPRPRIPSGTRLPDGFPYEFLGTFSTSWATVAVLLKPECTTSLQHLPASGNDRCMWFVGQPATHGERPLLLAAVYGPPGGGEAFWAQVMDDRRLLRAAMGAECTYIIGDLNIHPPDLVDHSDTCHCAHCKPSNADVNIWKLLLREGFSCHNPLGEATHSSGTIIDLILCDTPSRAGTA